LAISGSHFESRVRNGSMSRYSVVGTSNTSPCAAHITSDDVARSFVVLCAPQATKLTN